ncbi:MAG: chemotaxis protein CheW, partial [Planctomycetota bacterium]
VVELDSDPGKGTRLTIKLPLTLAILPSLMVNIGGDVFAMPLEAVVEIVRIGRGELSTVHQQRVAKVRGRFISTVSLNDIFLWNNGSCSQADAESSETTLVIIGECGREIGLAVDHVIGEEDVVIKSMAENYRNVPGIAGASILGDGRVSLILDLTALIDMASRKGAAVS